MQDVSDLIRKEISQVKSLIINKNITANNVKIGVVNLNAAVKPKISSSLEVNPLNEQQLRELNTFEEDLNKLESNLNDPSGLIYEECSELRRVLQHRRNSLSKS